MVSKINCSFFSFLFFHSSNIVRHFVAESCFSKWDFPKSRVLREVLKVILTCCQAGGSLWGRVRLLMGLSCDSSPPLLSNSSLSPANDLLLLFLVPTKIFLIPLSQKLCRKHLRWGSSEISHLKSGQLRISRAWWLRRPVWLDTRKDFCRSAEL